MKEDYDSTPDMLVLETFDTTSGTTAGTNITYTLKFSISGTNAELWTNRVVNINDGSGNTSQRETGVSEIIIMEIGV